MSASGSFQQNTAEAQQHLARFASAPLGHLIDGGLVPSTNGETFGNTSPIDGSRLGDVACGDHTDIDAAAHAPDGAFR